LTGARRWATFQLSIMNAALLLRIAGAKRRLQGGYWLGSWPHFLARHVVRQIGAGLQVTFVFGRIAFSI
jgi:hypothetical protein